MSVGCPRRISHQFSATSANRAKMSKKSPAFGQVVIGPPGSGKTTYCKGMMEFLGKMGRKVAIVNMDPANDALPYDCSVDISDLITLSEVMDCLKLGPNGGLIYCMEFLEKNLPWFQNKLKEFADAGYYFLFDCPGQVELYTHHDSVKKIFQMLEKDNFRLVAVHLVDSHYCSDPGKFISVLLTSLSTMLQIELPHVNVLSKMDLIQQYGKLPFSLDFFTDVLDLSYLLEMFEKDPFLKKYKNLNKALTDVIQDYGLVSFSVLCIEDKETMLSLVKLIDKAGGYVFGIKNQDNMASMMSCAAGTDFEYFIKAGVQEKYIDSDEESKMDQCQKWYSLWKTTDIEAFKGGAKILVCIGKGTHIMMVLEATKMGKLSVMQAVKWY